MCAVWNVWYDRTVQVLVGADGCASVCPTNYAWLKEHWSLVESSSSWITHVASYESGLWFEWLESFIVLPAFFLTRCRCPAGLAEIHQWYALLMAPVFLGFEVQDRCCFLTSHFACQDAFSGVPIEKQNIKGQPELSEFAEIVKTLLCLLQHHLSMDESSPPRHVLLHIWSVGIFPWGSH